MAAARSPADGRVHVMSAGGAGPGRSTEEFVLLWASCALRTRENAALEHAVHEANRRELPLLAVFALTADYPGANERSFAFLLEGLRHYQQRLRDERDVQLVVLRGSPPAVVMALAHRAALLVADVGYTRVSRQWHRQISSGCPCQFHAVESEVVVPVELASKREEPAAATLRPKLRRHFQRFLKPLASTQARVLYGSPPLENLIQSLSDTFPVLDLVDDETESGQRPRDGVIRALESLGPGLDRSVPRVDSFRGGSDVAEGLLQKFVAEKLPGFATFRKDPNARYQSNLSPYLHFGFISPVYVALTVMEAAEAKERAAMTAGPSWPCAPRAESSAVAEQGTTHARAEDSAGVDSPGGGSKLRTVTGADVEAFLDELVVRRELARNFVWYNPHYDKIDCLQSTAGWALETLQEHQFDSRPHIYTYEELEAGQTEDKYWNVAQHEMVCTGKMHNYMRMYWGKRLLEWSTDAGIAYSTAIRLNDKWSLDGRDPNGYMGVAWCFGNHDAATPFGERAVFGTVRSMTPGGLQRKFNIDAYVAEVADLCRSVRAPALRRRLGQYWKKGGQTGLRSFFKQRQVQIGLPAPPTLAGQSKKRPAPDTAEPSETSACASKKATAAMLGQGTGLTAEQREKIEANRQRALERRAQRLRQLHPS